MKCELLPCPFCGGEVELHQSDTTTYGRYFYSIQCDRCPQVNVHDREEFHHDNDGRYVLKHKEGECIERWNTRANEQQGGE